MGGNQVTLDVIYDNAGISRTGDVVTLQHLEIIDRCRVVAQAAGTGTTCGLRCDAIVNSITCFATVQKIRSYLATPETDRLVSASASGCVCLLSAHSALPADRFETDSDHSDPCDETARSSLAPVQTWPLHAPTDTPNWWPATTAPDARVS